MCESYYKVIPPANVLLLNMYVHNALFLNACLGPKQTNWQHGADVGMYFTQ